MFFTVGKLRFFKLIPIDYEMYIKLYIKKGPRKIERVP
jgi:hypothetical protein